MAQYYFDIESEGFDTENHKIITIQYQEIGMDGKPIGKITILKEWESSEEAIVKTIYQLLIKGGTWGMVTIGCNLIFDFTFLWAKFKKYGLEVEPLGKYLYEKPIIDIKYSLIIANNLNFKGSGLDKMTNKAEDGRNVPFWYRMGDYERIESYIKQETDSFMEFFYKLKIYLNVMVESKDGK